MCLSIGCLGFAVPAGIVVTDTDICLVVAVKAFCRSFLILFPFDIRFLDFLGIEWSFLNPDIIYWNE